MVTQNLAQACFDLLHLTTVLATPSRESKSSVWEDAALHHNYAFFLLISSLDLMKQLVNVLMSYQLGITALDNVVVASPSLLSILNDCSGLKHSQKARLSIACDPTSAFSWEGEVEDLGWKQLRSKMREGFQGIYSFSTQLTFPSSFSLFFFDCTSQIKN